mgnify:CR=1 FL=1
MQYSRDSNWQRSNAQPLPQWKSRPVARTAIRVEAKQDSSLFVAHPQSRDEGFLRDVDLAELPRPIKDFLLGVLTAQVNALLPLQAKSGAWRTLLDDPTSYEETSATAGIGYGLLKGYRLGLGTPAWREAGLKAVRFVMDNIDDSGTVLNVSYGTRMGHDLQFYRDIPIQPTGYGQALSILCLSEALSHVDAAEKAA